MVLITGKPAKLSSVYRSETYPASKAVDGIYTENANVVSFANSNEEHRPWWRVDLVDIHCVWAVKILNRGTCVLHACLTAFFYQTEFTNSLFN